MGKLHGAMNAWLRLHAAELQQQVERLTQAVGATRTAIDEAALKAAAFQHRGVRRELAAVLKAVRNCGSHLRKPMLLKGDA
jgi:hypothetical protein